MKQTDKGTETEMLCLKCGTNWNKIVEYDFINKNTTITLKGYCGCGDKLQRRTKDTRKIAQEFLKPKLNNSDDKKS